MSKGYLQKLILEILEQYGELPEDLIATRVVEKMSEELPDKIGDRKVKPEYVITRTVRRMVSDGIVVTITHDTKRYLGITSEGAHKLSKLTGYENVAKKCPEKKLRLIVTMFSEEERHKRDALRKIFKQLGFSQLKPGIWVTDKSCKRLVSKLREDFSLTPNQLRLFIAEDSL